MRTHIENARMNVSEGGGSGVVMVVASIRLHHIIISLAHAHHTQCNRSATEGVIAHTRWGRMCTRTRNQHGCMLLCGRIEALEMRVPTLDASTSSARVLECSLCVCESKGT